MDTDMPVKKQNKVKKFIKENKVNIFSNANIYDNNLFKFF